MRIVFLIFISLLCIIPASAQLLIDIGYSPSFYRVDALNSIKSSFNEERTWLDEELNNFSTLHGVHARIKHRFKTWGPWIELNYQINSNGYSGEKLNASETTKGKVKSSYVSMIGGLEYEHRSFGFGAGLGQQTLRFVVKEQTGNAKIDDKILDEDNFVFTVYINLLPAYEPNNITNLVLQPYFVYPLSDMDFSSAGTYFNSVPNPVKDKFWQVGLRLILSNGQR